MGVKNLWDVLEPCKKTLPLDHLQNKRLCIDLSCWIVQLQNVNKSHCAIQDKLYLRGLFHRLRALIALNCSLLFVTDGSIPAIKLTAYRQRLMLRPEVTTPDETNSTQSQTCALRRNMGSEFSRMIREAKALGLALGIPCLDGVEEAEAQCALLNFESLCDGCFTSDSDVFLFGAKTVYRDICLGEGGYVICYEMADIERQLGFGRNSLITLALLLGSDYSPGVHGLGPESACQIVRSAGENSVLQRVASEGMSFAKKPKNSKKKSQPNSSHAEFNVNGKENSLDEPNQFLEVIDAYLKPKCHSADSDAVCRVLVQLPFQRASLQQICDQFFGWPTEKTDEYILPRIAERDLRRFANLRSSSSDQEVKPPLDKMAVKCPVTAIIKTRKAHGRECFEVMWEGIDGLKTSVVPAVLVHSACPEKIAEFEEKKAMGKKQNRNRRPKKSKNRSEVSEVDTRLRTLLLDNESGSNTTSDTLPSKEVILSEDITTATAAQLTSQDPLPVESQQSVSGSNACLPSSQTDLSLAKSEIVDLLSPSPPVRARKVSTRLQQVSKPCIDLIDSSESENEMSSEHARKARELRLFLASIRDDIS